jgi:hypothetical protein
VTKTCCSNLETPLSSRKTLMNRLARTAAAATLLAALVTAAFAQETGDQGAPPAATGPDTTTQIIENPPLSGLDEPSFEPGYGPRSYLLPRAQISQSVDTNASGSLGSNTTIKDVTRGVGALTLQEIWKTHPLDLDYSGGVTRYYGSGGKTYQLHSFAGTQRFLWRTGQLALRDSASYLPQGSFGFGSFGGAGAFSGGGGLGGLVGGGGIAGGGGAGVFGNTQFGALGNQPRVANMSIVDITQSISPRSTVVLSGGYGFTTFIDAPPGYLNSQQATGQVGYNYQVSRHDQLAVSYAYQEFHFPSAGAGSFNANVWQVMYGHRISGRLDVRFGGGPQWIHRNGFVQVLPGIFIPNKTSNLSGSGQASLTYVTSARTSMNLSYSHYTNPGSGFFAGSNTDAVHYGLNHSLTRRWNGTLDAGYSRNSRILSGPASLVQNANTYQYWFGGAALRRQLSRHFGAFASYQFESINFNSGFCAGSSNPNCSRDYGRHTGVIGLDWRPNPIRLD